MEEKTELLAIFKSFLRILYEFIKTAVFILLIFFIIRYFLIQPFIVDGNSMEPNFHDKEYLLVDKISYKFKEPKRGEVVIFHPPGKSVFFIKRIVGLPGEKIVIEKSKVFIYSKQNPKGMVLEESYLKGITETTGTISETLQDGQYFVLGDNRDNSSDSREFGSLPRKNITGRAFISVFPFSKFGLIKRPAFPNVLKLPLLVRQLIVGN